MKKIKLDYIIIPKVFLESKPSEMKIEKCRNKWRKYNKQPKLLVIDEDNVLIDGYIQYLVLKELGHEEGNYILKHESKKEKSSYRNISTTYIYGKHPNSNCDKEFMWRVPKSMSWFSENVQVGDSILCQTKFGIAPVIVNKIEILDECPIDIPVKKVCNKRIRHNGIILEIGN